MGKGVITVVVKRTIVRFIRAKGKITTKKIIQLAMKKKMITLLLQ